MVTSHRLPVTRSPIPFLPARDTMTRRHASWLRQVYNKQDIRRIIPNDILALALWLSSLVLA